MALHKKIMIVVEKLCFTCAGNKWMMEKTCLASNPTMFKHRFIDHRSNNAILGGHDGVCGLKDPTRLMKHRFTCHSVNHSKMVTRRRVCSNDIGQKAMQVLCKYYIINLLLIMQY